MKMVPENKLIFEGHFAARRNIKRRILRKLSPMLFLSIPGQAIILLSLYLNNIGQLKAQSTKGIPSVLSMIEPQRSLSCFWKIPPRSAI